MNALTDLQLYVVEWAGKTFPGQTAKSKADHLLDEARELADAPADGEEMADVFLLLLHIAHMGGVDLMEEARKKLAKNQARQWSAPDDRGVYHHVGTEEVATCAREGCAGIMGFELVKNCTCFSNPPCHACVSNPLVCLTCGATPDED